MFGQEVVFAKLPLLLGASSVLLRGLNLSLLIVTIYTERSHSFLVATCNYQK